MAATDTDIVTHGLLARVNDANWHVIASKAYRAYHKAMDGNDQQQVPIPGWTDLDSSTQEFWEEVVKYAVREAFTPDVWEIARSMYDNYWVEGPRSRRQPHPADFFDLPKTTQEALALVVWTAYQVVLNA